MLLCITFITAKLNHASSNLGSHIITASPFISKPHSILSANPEHYILSKTVYSSLTIKLANEIKIERIEFSNNEWQTSFITKAKVFLSEHGFYCGCYEFKPTRNKNVIDIKCDYYTSILRIDFIEFKGKHENFGLSQIKVYGRTLIDDILKVKSGMIKDGRSKQLIKKRVDEFKKENSFQVYLKYIVYLIVGILSLRIVYTQIGKLFKD